MTTVRAVTEFLEKFAPVRLAETWDNVGLLVGDSGGDVRRVMTCLTITPASAAEAVSEKADLIVAHHPLPFRAVKRLTTETTPGRMLLELAAARIAVYSAHTAFDSAAQGINQQIAEGLELADVGPLIPNESGGGTGRFGRLAAPTTLGRLADRLKQFLDVERLAIVGPASQTIHTVAIGCGAADELVEQAIARSADAMVIGEARFHTCLEAESADMALLMPGHFASERFAQEMLAEVLAEAFPDATVWASRAEHDPIGWA